MCELDILHDSLYQFCPELHLKRLNSLTLACHALLDCKTLTLTELGRNLPTKARTKHNIKRIDRLLGNRHLHKSDSLYTVGMLALSVRAIRCPLYLLTGLISVSKNGLWYCELQSHYTVVLLLFMRKRSRFQSNVQRKLMTNF